MIKNSYYPFSAIVGQNDIKEALILNLINPKIGGVIINGEKGSAKSTLVRSLIPLVDYPFIEAPISVSEDCLCGSIDLEKTISNGKIHVEDGLLTKANGGILYIDEINLMPDNINDLLLQTLTSGVNRIEREGVSSEHESRFIIIGTMNNAEGDMRSQLLDHFGLYAQTEECRDIDQRIEVVKRNAAFEENAELFADEYKQQEEELQYSIRTAIELMEHITLTDDNLDYIVNACVDAGVEGHRADIILAQTAMAVAAFHDKTIVETEQIDEAAYFVFPHRRHEKAPKPQQEEQPEEEDSEEDQSQESEERSNEDISEQSGEHEQQAPSEGNGGSEQQKSRPKSKPQNAKVGDSFKVIQFSHLKDRKLRIGAGKRTTTKTASKSGRYVTATMHRTNNDLALDATIRAAAPYQQIRDKNGLAISIRTDDIREKVRQKRVSNLLVFVVDASGSMGAQKRMTETKGAILSLLKDAYVKRDKISLVSFNGDQARVILPPTNSVERGYELLREIETGGKTPLNLGIDKGLRVIQSELRRKPDIMPMMIVITDGRGNVSEDASKKPLDEMLEKCEKIREIKQINSMVIDIEKSGIMNFGFAKLLADGLNAKYFKLEQLKSNEIVNIVGSGRS